MTSSPTFFTVEADFRAVLEDISSDSDYDPQIAPISGTVTFTPILNSGDVILATDADPRPIGFLPTPVVGKIDPADGRLKLRTETDLGGEGEFAPVRLLADTDLLELSTPLYYRVEFSSIRLGSRVGKITGFSFRAPTSDTTVNLIEVGRAPGLAASGTYHIAPAAVRVVNDEMVFSFGGVDIPDPVPLVDLTGPAVAAQAASEIHAAAEKANPVDADEVPLLDSAASFGWKRWSWANIKAALGAWYDTATRTLTNKTLDSPTLTTPAVQQINAADGGAALYLEPNGAGTAHVQVNRSAGGASVFANNLDGRTDVSLSLKSKGGSPISLTNTNGNSGLSVYPLGTNYLIAASVAPGSDPYISGTSATETNVGLDLRTKGSGSLKANSQPIIDNASPVVSGGANEIPSGDFEDARLIVTNGGTKVLSTTQKRSGTQSLKLTGYAYHFLPQNTANGAQKTVPCNPGDWVSAEAWVYGDDANQDTSETLTVRIDFLRGDGTWVNYSARGLAAGDDLTGKWTKLSLDMPAPANTVGYSITLYQLAAQTTVPGNAYYWDDLRATKTPPTTSGRLVGTTATGGSGAEDGAGTWTKIAEFDIGTTYQTVSAVLNVTQSVASNENAVIAVHRRNLGTGDAPVLTVDWVSKPSAASFFTTNSFKFVVDNWSGAAGLWLRKNAAGGKFSVYELSSYRSHQYASIRYFTDSAWQSAVPTGTTEVTSSGDLNWFGAPVVTTTGAQSLTNKTLTDPMVNSYIKDANGNNSMMVIASANAVNYLGIRNRATGSAPKIEALGSDASVNLELASKGSGLVYVNGVPVVTTTGAQTLTNKTLSSPTLSTSVNITSNTSGGEQLLVDNTSATGRTEIFFRENSVNKAYIQWRGTENAIFPNSVRFQTSSGSNADIHIGVQSNANIFIAGGQDGLTAGNVGIGTATPSSKLEVNGEIRQSGVPVVTTSGTQALTNKTISGASNTVTNLPASATPEAARQVRQHNTVLGDWYKVLTLNATADPYRRFSGIYAVSTFAHGSVVFSVSMGTLGADQVSGTVEILSAGTNTVIADNAFKIVNNGYGQPFELWVKASGGGSILRYYVLSALGYENVTYDTSNTGQSAEPTGSVLNVYSSGVTARGLPVVTTSGTATLTNKTLSSPTINSPRIDSIKDTNGNSIVALAPVANAVNYFTIANAAAGSIPSISTTGTMRFSAGGAGYLEARNGNGVIFRAKADQASTVNNLSFLASASGTDVEIRGEGSDTNVGVTIRPQGAGTLKVGSNPVGVKVAVPASNSATGTPGQWAADTDYIYVCTATDTWRRAALSTW